MFEDEEDEWFGADFNEQLETFNQMYERKEYSYIDADQVEVILDHLLIANQFKKAKWAAEQALKHFPFNNTILLRKAQAMSLAGELHGAIRILSQLEKMDAPSLDLLLTTAACYSQLRDSDSAIKYFRRAIEFSEGDERTEIYLDLAMEYENQKNYREAINTLEQALKEDKRNEAIIYELAYCYEQLEDYENAVKSFLFYIDEDPYSYTTWYNLGNAYVKMGEFEKALWAYDYCTVINDEFAPAFFNMANTYMDQDNFLEALKFYKKCLEIDGDDGMVYCSLGECYEELGEYSLAYDAYTKSAELLPHLADAWLGKGIISDLTGYPGRAISELSVALQLEPENPNYLRALASAYENDEQLFLAADTYEKAHEFSPEDHDIAMDWFNCLGTLDPEQALEKYYEKETLQNNEGAKLAMTYIHWLLGNQSDAVFYFEEVALSNANLAKSLFLHFPALKSAEYFGNRLEELEESNEDEEF
ncbi:MAG: tetratricopeptide repeat protein [Brumimicrobium sp.]|nr:tetratricopeptide repeat protein [Brumimicrobium sp.]